MLGAKTQGLLVKNREAHFHYEILERLEAGIALLGTEIKSIRTHRASLQDSYVVVRGGEAWVLQMHVSPYAFGNIFNHEPKRSRRLLLHKKEILRLDGKLREKGLTLVPLAMYLKKGRVKLEIALCRGKTRYDKREDVQKRDAERDIRRVLKGS